MMVLAVIVIVHVSSCSTINRRRTIWERAGKGFFDPSLVAPGRHCMYSVPCSCRISGTCDRRGEQVPNEPTPTHVAPNRTVLGQRSDQTTVQGRRHSQGNWNQAEPEVSDLAVRG